MKAKRMSLALLVLLCVLSVILAACGNTAHTHDFTVVQTVEATCENDGFVLTICTCGESKRVDIPALGHDTVTHGAKAPTCTGGGWEAYEACSRCDYSTYEELSANGHSL
ncbi:MAG: hypothetical protein IJF71_05215, partial [Clostridia bacterium]|nr:hypothetical protein [Clostridia bacterium]